MVAASSHVQQIHSRPAKELQLAAFALLILGLGQRQGRWQRAFVWLVQDILAMAQTWLLAGWESSRLRQPLHLPVLTARLEALDPARVPRHAPSVRLESTAQVRVPLVVSNVK
jgi:hypothetical protein